MIGAAAGDRSHSPSDGSPSRFLRHLAYARNARINRRNAAHVSSQKFRVDADKVQAHFDNGILEIGLQRLEADRPKKIEIRAA